MDVSLRSATLRMPPALENPNFTAEKQPQTSSSPPYTTSPIPETTSENVITLVDSSGREFHTNLRASDLKQLVKLSIVSSLHSELRTQNRRQKVQGSQRNLLKSDQILPLTGKIDINSSLPNKLKIPKSLKIKKEEDNSGNDANASRRGKRCRKVYGIEHFDKWCRQCKWKKSCARFADPVDLQKNPMTSPTSGMTSPTLVMKSPEFAMTSPALTLTRSQIAQQQNIPAPLPCDGNLSFGTKPVS